MYNLCMRFIRAIFLATLIGLAFTLMGISKQRSSPRRTTAPTPTVASPSPAPQLVGNYSMYLQPIAPDTLRLIPNFTQQKTSSDIMEEHGCAYGANGGYYTTTKTPLGLFVAEGIQLGSQTTSSAANAFLVKHSDGTLAISQTPPSTDTVSFALQAGPYLIPGVTPRITNDEHARRVLIGRTKEGIWHFIVIVHSENAYDGPLLSEIPTLLAKGRIPFTEVLNLDGGTASAFYNVGGHRFGELTMVGSFFCGK